MILYVIVGIIVAIILTRLFVIVHNAFIRLKVDRDSKRFLKWCRKHEKEILEMTEQEKRNRSRSDLPDLR